MHVGKSISRSQLVDWSIYLSVSNTSFFFVFFFGLFFFAFTGAFRITAPLEILRPGKRKRKRLAGSGASTLVGGIATNETTTFLVEAEAEAEAAKAALRS